MARNSSLKLDPPQPRAQWTFPFDVAFRDQRTMVWLVALILAICAGRWIGQGTWTANQIAGPEGIDSEVVSTIDINSAGADELCLLPRVGPRLAGRIIDDRQRLGPYRRLEDLDRVRGIGTKTLEQLRPYVVFASDNQDGP